MLVCTGSTAGLPFYENYYAGGFNSVRGFKDSALGPRSTPSTGKNPGTIADPDQDPLPFGGNVLIQGGVEVLFPMPFVKDQRSLRTSVFWDVGNVFDTNCKGETQVTPTPTELAILLKLISQSLVSPFSWCQTRYPHPRTRRYAGNAGLSQTA